MHRTQKLLAAGAGVVVLVTAGTGIAFAVAGDEDEALRGKILDRASAAALAHTGGGRVTDTEIEDQRYEIEVTMDDGREIDVHLDRELRVVATAPDTVDDGGDD